MLASKRRSRLYASMAMLWGQLIQHSRGQAKVSSVCASADCHASCDGHGHILNTAVIK